MPITAKLAPWDRKDKSLAWSDGTFVPIVRGMVAGQLSGYFQERRRILEVTLTAGQRNRLTLDVPLQPSTRGNIPDNAGRHPRGAAALPGKAGPGSGTTGLKLLT